jgi:hypothetical protein
MDDVERMDCMLKVGEIIVILQGYLGVYILRRSAYMADASCVSGGVSGRTRYVAMSVRFSTNAWEPGLSIIQRERGWRPNATKLLFL